MFSWEPSSELPWPPYFRIIFLSSHNYRRYTRLALLDGRFYSCPMGWFLLFLGLLAPTAQACFRWPKDAYPLNPKSEPLIELHHTLRLQRLAEEMNRFSRQVGSCYGRLLVGKAERIWASGERDRRIQKIYQAETVQAFCAEVKKNLVDKKLSNWGLFDQSSPFRQYANCGEGALVGACLAYAFGFEKAEVLLCESSHDHAWALVPEPQKEGSFCLLDRWNEFRCGVTFSGTQKNSTLKGNFSVPGKKNFKFSDAICFTLEDAPEKLEPKGKP